MGKHRKETPKKKISDSGKFWVALFSVTVACIATLVFTVPFIDKQGEKWLSCEVIEANVMEGNNKSMVPWYLTIDTKNCNLVGYVQVNSKAEASRLANQLEPGETYDFKFGLVSQFAANASWSTVRPTAKEIALD